MPAVGCKGSKARPARCVPWQARLIGLQQYMLALLLVGYASFLAGERLSLEAVPVPVAPPLLQLVPAAVPVAVPAGASERALTARQTGAAASAAPGLFWQASDRSFMAGGTGNLPEQAARQALASVALRAGAIDQLPADAYTCLTPSCSSGARSLGDQLTKHGARVDNLRATLTKLDAKAATAATAAATEQEQGQALVLGRRALGAEQARREVAVQLQWGEAVLKELTRAQAERGAAAPPVEMGAFPKIGTKTITENLY